MRITTQMIHRGAKKSGLPVRSNSLIDALSKKENAQHPLLAALQSKNTAATTTTTKSALRTQYEKQEKAANLLLDQMKKPTDVKVIADRYNSLLTSLGGSADSLDTFYKQSLKDLTAAHKEQFAKIGVTTAKDGRLQVNAGRLKNAPAESVASLFGENSAFMTRVGFIAERVADRAKANLSSATGNYSKSGIMSYQDQNRYNFKG